MAKQLSFAEMMAQMDALKAQIADQAQEQVAEIKAQLEEIAHVTGKSIADLLGIAVPAPAAVKTAGATAAAVKASDPDYDKFVAEHEGRTVENPENGNQYVVGKARGRAAGWIRDNYKKFVDGIYSFADDDEPAPGEVKPE